ncbi:MAG TPA: ATPase domain-containing protein [Armatimonadota bacterium]|nr:ATPase domain-containing protein [Armatimonadota bacterium]
MSEPGSLSTGIPFIDEMLGGGVDPGAMTIVHGATGVGKTQLGLGFLDAGQRREGRRGVVVDLATRGDSQQHAEYARRLFDWEISEGEIPIEGVFDVGDRGPDLFKGLDYSGRPVTKTNMDAAEWQRWQGRLQRRMQATAAYLYGSFTRGARRIVIDGVEPSVRVEDSIQLQLIEFIYQQILRTDHDWVARNLLRGKWMEIKDLVAERAYDKDQLATMILQTSNEIMLQDLLTREIVEGDLATNANTVIFLGRWQDGNRLTRAAFILKHRGRPCSEEVVPFTITDSGLERA